MAAEIVIAYATAPRSDAPTRVAPAWLRDFIGAAFRSLGMRDDDAAAVAALMAEADLQGSDGHGVTRLPQYARRIKAGGLNVRPNIHVVREQAGTALLNGDNGIGGPLLNRAAASAPQKGPTTGIAWGHP